MGLKIQIRKSQKAKGKLKTVIKYMDLNYIRKNKGNYYPI